MAIIYVAASDVEMELKESSSPYNTQNDVPIMKKKPIAAQWKNNGRFLPTWESLDKRPRPVWYDKAKFGIFVHWVSENTKQ